MNFYDDEVVVQLKKSPVATRVVKSDWQRKEAWTKVPVIRADKCSQKLQLLWA